MCLLTLLITLAIYAVEAPKNPLDDPRYKEVEKLSKLFLEEEQKAAAKK